MHRTDLRWMRCRSMTSCALPEDAGLEITNSDSRFYHHSADSVIGEPDPNIVVAKANGSQHLTHSSMLPSISNTLLFQMQSCKILITSFLELIQQRCLWCTLTHSFLKLLHHSRSKIRVGFKHPQQKDKKSWAAKWLPTCRKGIQNVVFPEPKHAEGTALWWRAFQFPCVDTDKQTPKCVFGLNLSLKTLKNKYRCNRAFYSWVTWKIQVSFGCVFCFSVIWVFASNQAPTHCWDFHPPPVRRITWSHFRCNRFSHVFQKGFVCRCFGRSTVLLCNRIHIITPIICRRHHGKSCHCENG